MREIDILARTLYGEVRGEYGKIEGGVQALISVANVVMNRVALKTWYGKTIEEVCLKPFQFSCWNKNDPNLSVIQSVMPGEKIFDLCLEVAEKVSKGQWPDITKGSNHYYAEWMATSPSWARGRKPLCKIGCHLFFKL